MALKMLKTTCILSYFCIFVNCLNLDFETLSTIYLPYTYSPTPKYELDHGVSETITYDSEEKLIYSVGENAIHVMDISNVTNPDTLYHKTYENVSLTSVAVCGGHVFIAVENKTVPEGGFVEVFKAYNKTTNSLDLIHHIIVGNTPDMIKATKDCNKVVVAIEAEGYVDTVNQKVVDDAGAVAIITFTNSSADVYNLKLLTFEKFNTRYEELEPSGVRWIYRENNNTFSNDLEPEFIAFSTDESRAYICLQENNAIAVVDMATEEIEEIHGLGFKQWKDYTIDPSDEDGGINMRPWDVYGMYQPDAILVYHRRGVDYIITANEGDSKDYAPYFTEEATVADLDLSDLFESNETLRDQMKENHQLGRLQVTTENGKNATTGKYDRVYTFGGRGFSIRRADTMELEFDSGDDMALKTALLHPDLFNSEVEPTETVASMKDSRSPAKGPETEGLAIGRIRDITLILASNEKPGTIAVYSIDERIPNLEPQFETMLTGIARTNDTWEDLYASRELSMLDPESVWFVPEDQSPNGHPLVLVSGSISGTVTIIQVNLKDDETSSAAMLGLPIGLQVLCVVTLLWRYLQFN